MLKGKCKNQALFQQQMFDTRGVIFVQQLHPPVCVCFWELLKCVNSEFVNQKLLILV